LESFKIKPIRVLLVDDHVLVRAGIHALLKNFPEIQIIAEAGDGNEALHLISKMQPDTVLLDIAMPKLNGLDVADRVIKEFPKVRVIILTMHINEEYVKQAIRIGVNGYILKNSEAEELNFAIKSVARGEVYLSPLVSKQVIMDYNEIIDSRKGYGDFKKGIYRTLTSRQREILQLIAEGFTTKEIANSLNLSLKTAEAHRTQLMERLNIHDIAGLVRYAIRTGITRTDYI